jgi:hypothetical protein
MPADGVPVRIASGVDLSGLDVVLTDAPQKRVSLTSPISPEVAELVEPDNPIEAYFWLRESGIRRREMQRHILERDGDDRYLTGPLGPGEYLVVMRYDLRPGVRTSGLDLTAIDPIAVFSISIEEDAPEMIDLGVIVPQTYPSVQGSLTVESDDRSLRDLALAGEVPELALIPRAVGGSYNTTIETDGQFQLARVPPGFYKLHINGIPDGWYVSRASSGGRDILNDGMLVEGAVSPLDVRLAEGTGRIAGFVRNRDSQPVADSRVFLIPPVQLRGPFTQYPTTVSDEAGAWALEGVPPGNYRVVAL